MDLGWVGTTQVGSEEVRTCRWRARQRSSGTTGGISGSTSISLKLSDEEALMKNYNESGMVKGSFSFNSRRTMRMRPPKIILRNSELKCKSHLSSTLMQVKLLSHSNCFYSFRYRGAWPTSPCVYSSLISLLQELVYVIHVMILAVNHYHISFHAKWRKRIFI